LLFLFRVVKYISWVTRDFNDYSLFVDRSLAVYKLSQAGFSRGIKMTVLIHALFTLWRQFIPYINYTTWRRLLIWKNPLQPLFLLIGRSYLSSPCNVLF